MKTTVKNYNDIGIRMDDYDETSIIKEVTFSDDVDENTEKEKKNLYSNTILLDKSTDVDFSNSLESEDVMSLGRRFRQTDFIGNENWQKTIFIDGIIVDITHETVIVECLINKKDSVFQIRKFNKIIFEEFPDLHEGSLIMIRIRTKSGSQRFDIFDAKGISSICKRDFEYTSNIKENDKSFSKPLPNKW